MTVYVDKAGVERGGRRWNHMTADTLEELHAFAGRIGLRRSWFHRGSKYPHYDVTDIQRDVAIMFGAVAVDRRTLLRAAKMLRESS